MANRNSASQVEAGARLIRALRERAGLSQVEVEVKARLGEHYLKRIELGQIIRPQRATLERILEAVDATYDEQRRILELYEYAVANPLPTDNEIAAAKATFHRVLRGLDAAAQLLDCAQRLQAMNGHLERLVGRKPGDPRQPEVIGQSILAVTYDPQYGIRQRICNLAEWSQHMLPVLIHELQPFANEPWCQNLLDEIRERTPGLDAMVREFRSERRLPARPLVPIIFQSSEGEPLPCWVATELFTDDSRFRVTYYLPAAESTLRQFRRWKAEGEDQMTIDS